MITATATLTGTITATAQIRSVQTGSCAAATVTNQAEDYSLSIASGATEKLPFGKVKNKEGNDVQVDYKPAADGYIFQETACPSSPSISLSVSNTTPDFEDTVTLTAIPTGFAPTSYTFWLPNQDGTYNTVTQVSNIYVWTVDITGTFDVVVTAMDGLVPVSNSVTISATYSFNDVIVLNGTTQSIQSNQPANSIICGEKWLVSFWFNADTLANSPIICSYDIFWFIQIRSTDVRIRFNATGTGKTYAKAFSAGNWYHVLIQRTGSGDNVDVYVDSVKLTTITGSVGSDVTNYTSNFLIGDYDSLPGLEYDGKIDDFLIMPFHNASQAQITSYYNSGNGSHPFVFGSNIYTWLPFNGNVNNAGTTPFGFTAINSPTYTPH